MNIRTDHRVSERLKNIHVKDDVRFFDVSVSNPPYQRDTGNGAVALYHHVMNIAQLFTKNISMIYPARWMNGGRGEGLEEFRNNELHSQHYRTFIVESGESTIFEDNNIKGGVNYFHWTVEKTHETKYDFNKIPETRNTLLNGFSTMVFDPRFSHIMSKVKPEHFINVMTRNYYGTHLEADYNIEKLSQTLPEDLRNVRIGEEDFSKVSRVYYSGKAGGVRTVVIPKNSAKYSDEGYKLLVSRTADPDRKDKNTLRRQNRLFIIKPGEICGGSFLQAGLYDTEQESLNALKYLRSSFAIFMLGAITPVPSTSRKNYAMIPDVDFANGVIKDFANNDNDNDKKNNNEHKLDFNETYETLDEQLFKIYKIDKVEQELIHKVVKKWSSDAADFGSQLIKE